MLGFFDEGGDFFRAVGEVAVEGNYPAAASNSKAGSLGIAGAVIGGSVDDDDFRVAVGQPIDYLAGAVGADVVDDDDFGREFLFIDHFEDLKNELLDIALLVMSRGDDAVGGGFYWFGHRGYCRL